MCSINISRDHICNTDNPEPEKHQQYLGQFTIYQKSDCVCICILHVSLFLCLKPLTGLSVHSSVFSYISEIIKNLKMFTKRLDDCLPPHV